MAESLPNTSEDLKIVFDKASAYVKNNISKLNKQQILKFYSYYKQATEGPCAKSKPHWYELMERQKWESWSMLNNMKGDKAMQKYIDLLSSIDPEWAEKPLEIPSSWVHHSCMKNNDEIVEDSKKTIFDWVKESNLEKVKGFSKNSNLEINKLDETGLSLLHWAADRGSVEVVKYLVESLKAEVNLKDSNGQTPLHFAVSCEYDDVANYLIEAGADINVKDNDGLSPYEIFF